MDGPRILCLVTTSPTNAATKAVAVNETWGRRCHILNRQGIVEVYRRYDGQYDWLFKVDDDAYVVVENLAHLVDDDAYVVVENLAHLVSQYRPTDPICCLKGSGVVVGDARDELGEPRFFHFEPEYWLNPYKTIYERWAPMKKYQTYNYSAGMKCCSSTAISFHYIKPDAMYVMEYLIYKLRVV
ncbi:unnamed protein product [Oppiella nova]|uniref:Hexosyltransferase n=1 Tax=Oppiella nova TaxID=334625 RepID=A0A7R9LMN0_9ACAR|nr:unnamed protein product [Oppiella nova]CAG2165155.1 unnamed protein product [Oppiella nova]